MPVNIQRYSHLAGRLIAFELDSTPYGDERTNVEFEVVSGTVEDVVASSTSYLPMMSDNVGTLTGAPFTYHQTQGRTVTVNFQGVLLLGRLPWDTLKPGSLIQNVAVTLNRGGLITQDGFYDQGGHVFDYGRVVSCRHVWDTTTHQVFEISFLAHGTYEEPGTNGH
jgi:hypothetical protein